MMNSLQDEISTFARKHEKRLDRHTNPAGIRLLDNCQDIGVSNAEDHNMTSYKLLD